MICLISSWYLPPFFHNLCFFWCSLMAVSYLLVCWIRASPPECRGEGLCYTHSSRRNRPFFCHCTFPSRKWALKHKKKKNTSEESLNFLWKVKSTAKKVKLNYLKMVCWRSLWLWFWSMKYFPCKLAVGIGSSPHEALPGGKWTGHFTPSR